MFSFSAELALHTMISHDSITVCCLIDCPENMCFLIDPVTFRIHARGKCL